MLLLLLCPRPTADSICNPIAEKGGRLYFFLPPFPFPLRPLPRPLLLFPPPCPPPPPLPPADFGWASFFPFFFPLVSHEEELGTPSVFTISSYIFLKSCRDSPVFLLSSARSLLISASFYSVVFLPVSSFFLKARYRPWEL